MFLRRFACLMVFNATFNNNSVISCQVNFIFGGNRSTRRKPHFLKTLFQSRLMFDFDDFFNQQKQN